LKKIQKEAAFGSFFFAQQKAGSPYGLPAFTFDYRERRGKMVCVKSVKLSLDDFILQVKTPKVNRSK